MCFDCAFLFTYNAGASFFPSFCLEIVEAGLLVLAFHRELHAARLHVHKALSLPLSVVSFLWSFFCSRLLQTQILFLSSLSEIRLMKVRNTALSFLPSFLSFLRASSSLSPSCFVSFLCYFHHPWSFLRVSRPAPRTGRTLHTTVGVAAAPLDCPCTAGAPRTAQPRLHLYGRDAFSSKWPALMYFDSYLEAETSLLFLGRKERETFPCSLQDSKSRMPALGLLHVSLQDHQELCPPL